MKPQFVTSIPLEEIDRRKLEQTREFPVMAKEAYIGLAGEIVRLLERHTESDPVALLLNAHVCFGNAVGRGPHYRVEGTEHGPNLFVVQVGDSSKARKGTGLDRVKQVFRLADEEWVTRRIESGLSSGEGVIWAVRDAIKRMVKEGKGAQANMVEEEIDPGVSDKRLLVAESEFAGGLRVMGREGNILSRVLRDAWDRGDLGIMTKNSPARATGACISVIGHITQTELRQCLDKTEMANGFGNRILFACVRRSKLLPFGGNLKDHELARIAGRVADTINFARTIRTVTMSPDAAKAWEAIYAELSADRPGLLGALTARAEAQTVRLAMICALWDGKSQIEIEHLTAASAVWEFCQASVKYIFGDALGDVVADTILSALKTAGEQGITRTEIAGLFSRNQPANQISRALAELQHRQLATYRKAPASTSGGRPSETWFIVCRGIDR
jgi:hypothetical protein